MEALIQWHLLQRLPFYPCIRKMHFRRSIIPHKGQMYSRRVPVKDSYEKPMELFYIAYNCVYYSCRLFSYYGLSLTMTGDSGAIIKNGKSETECMCKAPGLLAG